jgi:hypothetical protein
MKTIFELCTLRRKVTKRSPNQGLFAANLKDVIDGVEDGGYKIVQVFIENTYSKFGLKTLLNDLVLLVGSTTGKIVILHWIIMLGSSKPHLVNSLFHAASAKTSA